MKMRNAFILTAVLCAILCAGNAFATKLAPVSPQPTTDTATPSSELSRPSVELAKPTADLSRPTTDIIKPASDVTRPAPEFQRPLRELKPAPVTNSRPSNNLENAIYTKQK